MKDLRWLIEDNEKAAKRMLVTKNYINKRPNQHAFSIDELSVEEKKELLALLQEELKVL